MTEQPLTPSLPESIEVLVNRIAAGYEATHKAPVKGAVADLVRPHITVDQAIACTRSHIMRILDGRYKKQGRIAVPRAGKRGRTQTDVGQLTLDGLVDWVAAQFTLYSGVKASTVADIERTLNEHPDWQISVSEVLAKAGVEW